MITQEHTPIYEVRYRSDDLDLYEDPVTPGDIAVMATMILGMLIGIAIWEWSMWRLVSKAGYKGISRWLLFLLLGIPPTTGCGLLVFVLMPWPVQKELKAIRQQAGPALKSTNNIEEELRRLKSNL